MKPGGRSDLVGIVIAGAGIGLALAFQGWNAPEIPHEAEYETRVVLPTPTPRPTQNLYIDAPCGCAYDAYNCSDFNSQEGGQLCYNWCVDQVGKDVHNLVYTDTSSIYAFDGWACISVEDWIKRGQP